MPIGLFLLPMLLTLQSMCAPCLGFGIQSKPCPECITEFVQKGGCNMLEAGLTNQLRDVVPMDCVGCQKQAIAHCTACGKGTCKNGGVCKAPSGSGGAPRDALLSPDSAGCHGCLQAAVSHLQVILQLPLESLAIVRRDRMEA